MKNITPLSLLLILTACGKVPVAATYQSTLTGPSKVVLDDLAMELDQLSGSEIMTAKYADLHIEVNYGDVQSGLMGIADVNSGYCNITLSKTVFSDLDLKQVLLHEIGHCFGLKHSDNERDIMYHQYIPEIHSSKSSLLRFIDQLNAVRGLN